MWSLWKNLYTCNKAENNSEMKQILNKQVSIFSWLAHKQETLYLILLLKATRKCHYFSYAILFTILLLTSKINDSDSEQDAPLEFFGFTTFI